MLTRTDSGKALGHRRRGVAPVEMTIVLLPLMLVMAAIISFGFNATWKLRTEIVSRDVIWRDRHPHGNAWNANKDVRNPEFPVAREGRTLEDDSGRAEQAYWRLKHDDNLTSFDDDEVTQAPIIRGPIRNINVNSELLNFARGVEMGVARILRKPNILPKMGQVDFTTSHVYLGDSFQYGKMNIRDENSQFYYGFRGWSNRARRIPYIYETELDFVHQLPAYVSSIEQVESVRIPLCLTIDEEILYYNEFGRFTDRHPRVRGFSSTDRDDVRDNYIDGDQGVKLKITGGKTSRGGQVHGAPHKIASMFISIWSRRLSNATTDADREFYKARIEALKQYQQTVE